MGRHAFYWFTGLVLGLLIGLGIGYQLWREVPDLSTAVTGDAAAVVESQIAQSAETETVDPSSFEYLEREIISKMSRHQYRQAINQLIELDLIAVSETEVDQVTALLEEAVRLRVGQLEPNQRFGEIDSLYESLTLSMPERGEYFLLLAKHRIYLEMPDQALPVLAQIENHHQLGGQARELIAELTAPEEIAPLAAISLQRRGEQYIVDARLDDATTVRLLLDTGASMTILTPEVIGRLGYRAGSQQARFSTANGVVEAPVIAIGSIALDAARVDRPSVGVLRLQPGVDGLLGMDFLSSFDFTLARDSHQLFLRELNGQ